MATVTVKRPPKPETTVTLTLSEDEAILIRTLVGSCNGSDENVNNIYNALDGAGIKNSQIDLPMIDLKSHPIIYPIDI